MQEYVYVVVGSEGMIFGVYTDKPSAERAVIVANADAITYGQREFRVSDEPLIRRPCFA